MSVCNGCWEILPGRRHDDKIDFFRHCFGKFRSGVESNHREVDDVHDEFTLEHLFAEVRAMAARAEGMSSLGGGLQTLHGEIAALMTDISEMRQNMVDRNAISDLIRRVNILEHGFQEEGIESESSMNDFAYDGYFDEDGNTIPSDSDFEM